MNAKLLSIACVTLGLGLSACGSYDGGTSEPAETTDLKLSVDIKGDTDVAGFEFKARKVVCATEVTDDNQLVAGAPVVPEVKYGWAEAPLEDLYLPGNDSDSQYNNSTFEDDPYRDGSQHHFADKLFMVEPGCYDLYAQPITADKEKSQDCAKSILRKVDVKTPDKIHEYHLVSQCRGEARTTLDIIGSLNHPPEGELEIQKFMCANDSDEVVACVTASDPDGDPLQIKFYEIDEWGNKTYVHSEEVYSHDPEKTKVCATITTKYAKTKNYKAVVKDLGWSSDEGEQVPIEDLLTDTLYGSQQQGEGDAKLDFDPTKSRATFPFPVHGIDEDDCIDAAMAFIGTTLGANLEDSFDANNVPDPDTVDPDSLTLADFDTDTSYGMTEDQAKQLAKNAVDYVNPLAFDADEPSILVVLDDANNDEDELDGLYIQKLLLAQGFGDVEYINEPGSGLQKTDVVSYDIVWLVNPGYPIDDTATFDTLLAFRQNGGGVIFSGDDANQFLNGDANYDMTFFSFMDFFDNGTSGCGVTTNNNGSLAGRYLVKFDPLSPLGESMPPHGGMNIPADSFPYGNDIDDSVAVNQGETVGAFTEGLVSDVDCLLEPNYGEHARDVMTTVKAGITYTP